MDDTLITREEMAALFGEYMPMEAVNLLFDSDGSKTVGELRAQLRDMAEARKMQNDPHPMQQIRWNGDVIRFRENAIVRFLLDAGPYDLNKLALMEFSAADRNQLAQLIGYSVGGFGDLSYAFPEVVAEADEIVEQMIAEKKS